MHTQAGLAKWLYKQFNKDSYQSTVAKETDEHLEAISGKSSN